ncbi:MAG: hypothetical protein C5B53_11765 [Candidatus Melainabacteria bacterium]|nr:MAG: hypothetical protein C5B53_11765 [Candidatus Melainabacteria bacterium]
MVDDRKDTLRDESAGSKNGKTKVDLFPALADRRMMPINAIRQPVAPHIGTQISIFSPVSFEEALDIVECLRGRAATTISLDNMKKWDASRLVDFVAGASAALDGDFHKLSEQVYIFCPSNIKITAPQASFPKGASAQGLNSLDFLFPEAGDSERSKAFTGW